MVMSMVVQLRWRSGCRGAWLVPEAPAHLAVARSQYSLSSGDHIIQIILALDPARGPAGLARAERVIEEEESVGFPESIV
jgi:hypothetical protein